MPRFGHWSPTQLGFRARVLGWYGESVGKGFTRVESLSSEAIREPFDFSFRYYKLHYIHLLYQNVNTTYDPTHVSESRQQSSKSSSKPLVMSTQRQRPRLRNHILLDRHILAGLLAIPGLLDPAKRRLSRGGIPRVHACKDHHQYHTLQMMTKETSIIPIIPASKSSNSLHVRSTSLVKK